MHYSTRPVNDRAEWHAHLAGMPATHLLQSWDWGDFKSRHGWMARRLLWERSGEPVAAAQILERTERRLGMKAGLIYSPKGPLLNWADHKLRTRVLRDLRAIAHQSGAMFLKIDPEVPLGYGVPNAVDAQPAQIGKEVSCWLSADGWRMSADQVQFRNTSILDLTCSEDELLASFKQKTRYNIRLAKKKGAAVRVGDLADIDMLYSMYSGTSVRNGFIIRGASYYHDAWASFIRAGLAQPLIAEVAGEPAAAVIIFAFGNRASYIYGMSSNKHRDKMPNHLLQWNAIRWSKAQGYTCYDFWGAPDLFDESDPMWGVWCFKAGFKGTVVRTIGAWDLPIHHLHYQIYTALMPRVLDIMRRRQMRNLLPSID